ncbi:von Willebrand factor type A domain-containing protein [Myxococcus sp. K15C18031901]|uniref:vWA domain-containing protein n=1 Tax=Myxococcus dinghuensis TaxID=2906761 RepID=UPI0020A7F5E5|nr:von Willebrand factor type A domain-containing protein [Myxococcus dinghuensis]MCP3104365.1 von Willebrand factor type A domain-containing protein [Myxococcus dinghuensis]
MSKRLRFILGAALTFLMLAAAGLTLFGDNIRKLFGQSSSSLAGNSDAAPVAYGSAFQRKKMSSFGSNTDGDPPPQSREPAPPPNTFTLTATETQSTFAVDVDTASYALFRRTLREGQRPPPSQVRVEEWVNYFGYRVPEPTPEEGAFHVALEAAPSPFSPKQHILKIGLQGRHISPAQRKPTHLVFLVDTSGSMGGADRLGLAKTAMKLAVSNLNPADTVTISTYAGDVRTVMETTPARRREDIERAIDALNTGGGTAMGDGLELAYRHAATLAGPNRVARVVVLTDGDTNLGRNLTASTMLEAVSGYVKEGVTLSTIGFGMGNYRDDLMEKLANKGNGNCFYIDSEKEARRVFQQQLAGTLEVIAQDVKVQVEFDPAAVRGYRLLGYENRAIANSDFRNDRVDAGEIGAGHTVTALYEVELTGEGEHVATVRVRSKRPGGTEGAEQRFSLERAQVHETLGQASSDLRFAVAVAGAADLMRGVGTEDEDRGFSRVQSLAEDATDGRPDREEFVSLLRQARTLTAQRVATTPY